MKPTYIAVIGAGILVVALVILRKPASQVIAAPQFIPPTSSTNTQPFTGIGGDPGSISTVTVPANPVTAPTNDPGGISVGDTPVGIGPGGAPVWEPISATLQTLENEISHLPHINSPLNDILMPVPQ